jgi:hypothetical protein
MGGCISNSYRVCGACTRKAPEDRDPTYVRIFGFFAFLSACIVIGLDTFVYAVVGLKYGVQLDLGNGFMLPVGAWWGGIFPFLAGFLAMFHGCRQGCFARCCCPAYCDPNRRLGLYNGPCGPCSCGKISALLAAIGVVIALLGAVWDAFAGLVRLCFCFAGRWPCANLPALFCTTLLHCPAAYGRRNTARRRGAQRHRLLLLRGGARRGERRVSFPCPFPVCLSLSLSLSRVPPFSFALHPTPCTRSCTPRALTV